MINGFEHITQPLTESEQKILPVIVRGLSKKIGSVNAVTNKAICAGLLEKYNVELSEARVRKIINHIRMNNLLTGLIATSAGYYISTNPKEISDYIQSLEGRKQAIEGIINRTKQHLQHLTT